jgi:hypothetical protein
MFWCKICKLSVCSLARYKIACELIKFSTGNLPSSALTHIFEEVFFVPRRCLQQIKWTFSKGVLSITTILKYLLWIIFLFTIGQSKELYWEMVTWTITPLLIEPPSKKFTWFVVSISWAYLSKSLKWSCT